jgi:very-short-patch-repair endonuclease
VAALARQQYGAFSRSQAFRIGVTDRMVHRRLASHDWLRPCSGVYVVASAPPTWLQRCKVAELSVPGSALAGRAAAALHGFEGFGQCRPELVVSANSSHRSDVADCHRYSGAKLTTVKGLRVTSIAQTVFDVSISAGPLRVERALDELLVAGRVTMDELDERAEFYEGCRRPGVPLLEPLLSERRAEGWVPPTNALEAALFGMLDRVPSHPRVLRQAPMGWWTDQPGRVDAYLPDQRLIIEADGRRWHTRLADFDRDRWRDNTATANGHGVLRFTWVHLHHYMQAAVDLTEQALHRLAA